MNHPPRKNVGVPRLIHPPARSGWFCNNSEEGSLVTALASPYLSQTRNNLLHNSYQQWQGEWSTVGSTLQDTCYTVYLCPPLFTVQLHVYLVTPAAALSITALWTHRAQCWQESLVSRHTGCWLATVAMCCVGVCVLPLRDRSNVDCQVPRQPWPLLCRELPCWPGPGAAYTYTLVHSVHPHSLISITLLLAIEARLPPTNLRDATISWMCSQIDLYITNNRL